MKKVQKNICFLLACIILITAIGCSNKKSGTSEPENKDADNVEGEGGKFHETEISLPDAYFEQNETGLNLLRKDDGTLEFFAAYDNETAVGLAKYTLQQDQSWQREELLWLENLHDFHPGQMGTLRVTWGKDGNYYCSYFSESSYASIARINEEQSAEQIEIPDLQEDGSREYLEISRLEIAVTGEIAAIVADEIVIYDGNTGEIIADDFLTGANDITLDKGTLWATNGTIVMEISVADGSMKQEDMNTGGDYSFSSVLIDAKEDGKIYITNDQGIDCITSGGSVWERVMDSAGGILSDPSYTGQGFHMINEEEFLVFFRDGRGGIKLVQFQYMTEEELANLKEITLNIYTLDDSNTIRNAISTFKAANPSVKINVTVGASELGNGRSDLIKNLNTEIMSGKGPDILIMDGLPAEAYIESGALTDISDVMDDVKDDLLPSVTEEFADESGVYMIPARIGIPYVLGNAEVTSLKDDFKQLAEYAEHSEKPFFRAISSEWVLRKCYEVYSNAILNDDGSLSEEGLSEFLLSVRKITENCVLKESEAEFSSPALEAAEKRTMLNLGTMRSMSDVMEMLAAKNGSGGDYASVADTYSPEIMMALGSTCEEPELAKDFIREVLSAKVQEQDFLDGFPVNEAALDSWADWEQEIMMATSSAGGEGVLIMEWPDRDEREELISMVKGLSVRARTNDVLLELLLDHVTSISGGDVDAVAADVANKMKLYMSE